MGELVASDTCENQVKRELVASTFVCFSCNIIASGVIFAEDHVVIVDNRMSSTEVPVCVVARDRVASIISTS